MSEPMLITEESILANYRLPRPLFANEAGAPEILAGLWVALRESCYKEAVIIARELATAFMTTEARAALFAGWATAELRLGNAAEALRLAARSLETHSPQWLAHRITIEALEVQRKSEEAYLYLADLKVSGDTPAWDEPLSDEMRCLGAAALAWAMSDWEGVAVQLNRLYPARIPDALLEDWFRLALYRNRPEDVAMAAEPLIVSASVDALDRLLQVLIQQGWSRQALELYRAAYARIPENALLRRRLVGLCLREGQIEEARNLARLGALEMAA